MWVVPVIHPAFTFRQPLMLGPLEAHVQGFVKRLVEGIPPTPTTFDRPSVEVFRKLVADAKRKNLSIGVDVEAKPPKGGRPELAKLPQYAVLRQFGVGAWTTKEGVGMSWPYPCDPKVWAYFKQVCADPKLTKVFVNGFSYDIPLLKRYGVTCR